LPDDVIGTLARPADACRGLAPRPAEQCLPGTTGELVCLTANHLADRNRMCRRLANPVNQAFFVNRADAALPPTFNETVATTWLVAATGSLPWTLLVPAGLRSTL
jgi:hypothetical protein